MRLLFVCAALLLALAAACGDGDGSDEPEPGATATEGPAPTSLSAIPTGPPGEPNVYGSVELSFVPYGPGAEEPEEPITLWLLLRPAGGGDLAAYPVEEEGSFAAAVPPGETEMAGLQIDAASLAQGPFIQSTGGPFFTAPEAGCAYVGATAFSLYRLPEGGAPFQLGLEEELEEELDVELETTYLIGGGLIQFDQSVSEGDPPDGAEDCDVALAAFEEDDD